MEVESEKSEEAVSSVETAENSLPKELLEIEELLDEITKETISKKVRISQACRSKRFNNAHSQWRKGPAESGKFDQESSGNKIAMLCVSDSLLNEDSNVLYETTNDSNRSLLAYFAWLGKTDDGGKVNYEFLEHIKAKADMNIHDIYGQTLMHEVAREWSCDLAEYLMNKGCHIDQEDMWGRTPLFVAVSSNHTQMVKWLLDNGADLNHQTIPGEEQHALHFAAKSDCIEAFDLLVRYGADPLVQDSRNRTPFFLAAENGNTDICSHMLRMELPVACYSITGSSTIDHLVENMPSNIALRALDQFIEKKGQYSYYYVNCLGKRRWKLLNKLCSPKIEPTSVLKAIINQGNMKLIKHPIILEMINQKAKFTKKYLYINVFWYFMFTFCWTISASVSLPRGPHFYHSKFPGESYTILLFTVFGQVLTLGFMLKMYFEYRSHTRNLNNYKSLKKYELELDRRFCHPAWSFEEKILNNKIEMYATHGDSYFSHGWNVIELFCLLMGTLQMVFTIHWYVDPRNETTHNTRMYFSAVFVVIVWVRLNRSLSFLQWLGPFIVMLGECVIATVRLAFLFFDLTIPFAVAFWVFFGSERKGVDNKEYHTANSLVYQLYLLALVGDYDIQPLKEINTIVAQVLVSFYIIFVSIVILNLYIALLSEAVARVNEDAQATVYLRVANELLTYEGMMPELREKFEHHINENCAPLCKSSKFHETTSALEKLRSVQKTVKSLIEDTDLMYQEEVANKRNIHVYTEKVKKMKREYSEMDELRTNLCNVYEFQRKQVNRLQRKARSWLQQITDPTYNI